MICYFYDDPGSITFVLQSVTNNVINIYITNHLFVYLFLNLTKEPIRSPTLSLERILQASTLAKMDTTRINMLQSINCFSLWALRQ